MNALTNIEVDPALWSTDVEPMTPALAARLERLCRVHGLPFDRRLSRGEARRLVATLEARRAGDIA